MLQQYKMVHQERAIKRVILALWYVFAPPPGTEPFQSTDTENFYCGTLFRLKSWQSSSKTLNYLQKPHCKGQIGKETATHTYGKIDQGIRFWTFGLAVQ